MLVMLHGMFISPHLSRNIKINKMVNVKTGTNLAIKIFPQLLKLAVKPTSSPEIV